MAALSALLLACRPETGAPVTVHVDNAAAAVQPAVNRRVLGSNNQWIFDGDGLLQSGSLDFKPDILAKVLDLAPTVLRYPGGTLTDAYHWQRGLGPLASRQQNVNAYDGSSQLTAFGTLEFQQLVKALGAEALISVNTVTGSADEAAAWVRYTNIESPAPDAGFAPVRYWEIGNEPYLANDGVPSLSRTPAQYLQALNAFVPAMKAADPSIKVGLPLAAPNFARFYSAPYSSYNQTVLGTGRTAVVDFVAVHNAYLPAAYAGRPDDNALSLAFAAGATQAMRDLDALKTEMLAHGLDVPFALTEYSPLVTIGQSSDNLMDSPAGALYIADLLTQWATRDDILMANHWSLIENGYFGAIGFNGALRPQFIVLRELSRTLRGVRLPVSVEAPSFDAPEVGFQPAVAGVPSVSAFACHDAGRLRIVLINRDAKARHTTAVSFTAALTGTVTRRSYEAFGRALNAFPDGNGPNFEARSTATAQGSNLSVELAPQSITVLDIGT